MILNDSSAILEIEASIISPGCIIPTPDGVPVKIRSPWDKGMSAAISHSISFGDQIISEQFPDCLSSPFTLSVSSRLDRSSDLLIGTISEIGALPRKFFPLNQGLPCSLARP